MQKRRTFLILFFILITLTACNQNGKNIPDATFVDVDASLKMPSTDDKFSFDETTFIYDNVKYDLSERQPLINAIYGYAKADNYLIISCHAGPKNGIYCIFDTTTQAFLKDIIGCNLIFYNNDIKTCVYSFWNDIFSYDGTLIQTIKMQKSGIIRSLSFINDYKEIEASIVDETSENGYTEIIKLGN